MASVSALEYLSDDDPFVATQLMRVLIVCLILAVELAAASAPFENLDFESASLPILSPGESALVPISQAYPGWSGFIGTTPVSEVLYDGLTFGLAALTIQRHEPGQAIEGSFHALLINGFHPDHGPSTPVALAQTGLIPTDAQSILFKAGDAYPFPPAFTLSLDGTAIPVVAMEPYANITLFGADISAFAGMTTELRFTTAPNQFLFLDAIFFSPVPVPEPSTWALVGSGLLCLAGYIRKRVRH